MFSSAKIFYILLWSQVVANDAEGKTVKKSLDKPSRLVFGRPNHIYYSHNNGRFDIDDLALWSDATLTDAEVTSVYQNGCEFWKNLFSAIY